MSFGVQLSVWEHCYPDSSTGEARAQSSIPNSDSRKIQNHSSFSGPKAKATRIPEPADFPLDEEQGSSSWPHPD